MSKLLSVETPIYIPQPIDGKIAENGTHYSAVFMDLCHAKWRPGSIEKMKAVTDILILDPATDKLFFGDASQKSNFKKLGYPEGVEQEKFYSDPKFRKEKLVHVAIEHQIKEGADVIIAPYFYFTDVDDTKFSINISMLSEAIQYLEEKKVSKPLFAMIEVGKKALTRQIAINSMVDRYLTDFKDKVDGYFVTIDDFDARRENYNSLLGLANLIFQLSNKKIVFPYRMNSFGNILIALGASGFSGGITSGESFSVKSLEEPQKGWSSKKKRQKTYISEFLDYLNDELVKKINYICKCPFCKGSFPQDTESKKNHFVYYKIREVEEIKKIDAKKRVDFMLNKLEGASEKALKINNDKGTDIPTGHLINWAEVLKAGAMLERKEDSSELETLLETIDKEND